MAQNENYSQVDLRVGTEAQFNSKVDTLPEGTLFGVTDATVSKADLSTDLKNEINGKQAQITSSNPLSANLVSGLATVATSGSYNDLSNKPTIPTKVSELTDASNYVTKTTYAGSSAYGVAKIWFNTTDSYLYIRTDGN